MDIRVIEIDKIIAALGETLHKLGVGQGGSLKLLWSLTQQLHRQETIQAVRGVLLQESFIDAYLSIVREQTRPSLLLRFLTLGLAGRRARRRAADEAREELSALLEVLEEAGQRQTRNAFQRRVDLLVRGLDLEAADNEAAQTMIRGFLGGGQRDG